MQDNKNLHDVNGQLAALAEGIMLLQEDRGEEFKNKVLLLMAKKCQDLKLAVQNLADQSGNYE